jgi:AcrR family transcriptional regulator
MKENGTTRIRRTADEAKNLILQSAENLLVKNGPLAVQVRAVAREAGLTDAGITHHFGSRDGLLLALMENGSAKVREAVNNVVDKWLQTGPDIASLVKAISNLYVNGYAALALHLYGTGWEDRGTVLLEPAVECLFETRRNKDVTKEDIRIGLASLHLWLALDPLFGDAFRRSAGLNKTSQCQIDWWIDVLEAKLGHNEQ